MHLSITKTLALSCTIALSSLQSCMITFVNDAAPGNVFILNHLDKNNKDLTTPDNFIKIPKGQKRRFNDPHEHAHFSVYIENKNSLNVAYEVMQVECGDGGNPIVKLSELKNNTINHTLFDVIDKNRVRTSMVHDLPMLKTAAEQLAKPDVYKSLKECAACNKK